MQNRAFFVAASLGLAMSAGAIPVRAAQVVWSGLVIAENVSDPSPIPTKLSRQSPLVIKGPLVGNGQLLLVLMVESGASTDQRPVYHQSNQFVTAWRHLSRAV